MSRCPECNEVLVNSRKCSNCNWRANKRPEVDRSCPECGAFGIVQKGGPRWYCREHAFPGTTITDNDKTLGKQRLGAILEKLKARGC
jgi:predicted RNA-binding Zn-ribbon protein involved in translation (DUF1610 family)